MVRSKNLNLSDIHLKGTGRTRQYFFQAQEMLRATHVDCTAVSFCYFEAKQLPPEVTCGRGRGNLAHAPSRVTGCEVCAPGRFQLEEQFSGPCHQCPRNAQLCTQDKLRLPPGMMLGAGNMLNVGDADFAVCPNPKACGGGELAQQDMTMCEDGYKGAGCAQCAGRYAPSDSNVLTCVKCAETAMLHVAQVVLWLAKLAVFFGLAAKSVLGSTIPAKASSVYFNQLISFSTLSGTVVSALLQTPIGQEMQAGAMGIVFGVAGLITDLGSGQGGGDSAGQSLQCSLAYAGFQPAIWKGHVAFALVAFGMMSGLAVLKGSQVAWVVGVNCFLPTVMTHFGRQLVCYRLSEAGDLDCPHVPTFPGGFSFVLCMAVGFASAVFYTWWRLYPQAQEVKTDVDAEACG